RRPIAVAESPDGLDRIALDSGRPDLSTQVADVQLDLLAGDAVLVAPDELEQLAVGEELVPVANEREEQPELARRQAQLAPADRRRPPRHVDGDEAVG